MANDKKITHHKSPFFLNETGLFANCYSTINDGLNIIKHIKHTHTYTHTHKEFAVCREFEASTLLLSRNFTRGGSQAETSISLLHTDQYTSSVRIEICLDYLISVKLSADLAFPCVS